MYLSVVFLVVETPRYRTPIDPFIVMLAALALVAAGRRAAAPVAVAARRPRVLTTRELNRAVLARQRLLDRARREPAAASSSASAASRRSTRRRCTSGCGRGCTGFERGALTRALERRAVVQATLMRVDDPPRLGRATTGRSRSRCAGRGASWWLRVAPDARPTPRWPRAAERAARARSADGPLRRAEVEALLGKPAARGVGLWLDLVRAPPSGTWERRRADLYARRRGLGRAAAGGEPARPRRARAASCAATSRRSARRRAPTSRAGRASGRPTIAPAVERLTLRRFAVRGRRRARRPPARAAAAGRHAGAGALPADLGRDAARPRAARADPPRGAPAADLQHEEPAVGPDVPRRRRGRRHVAVRRRPDRRSSRSTASTARRRRALREEAERLAAFHA